MKPVDAPSVWSRPSDLDKKESDGRDPPQRVAPHAHRGVVGARSNIGSRAEITAKFNAIFKIYHSTTESI